jgi:glycine hydroxymethyltransferase
MARLYPTHGATMSDFLFRGSLRDLDPDVYELTQIEAERQYRKLILIASESTAPTITNISCS